MNTPTSHKRYLRPEEGMLARLSEPANLSFPLQGGVKAWKQWKSKFSQRFLDELGPVPQPVPLDVEITERVEEETWIREHVVFNSEAYACVAAIVLTPKALKKGERAAGILCCHGHSTGKGSLIGLTEDDFKNRNNYQKTLARQLTQRGYVTISPDFRGFGERRPSSEWTRGRDSCNCLHVGFGYLGFQLLALHIMDARRTLDYLQTRPDVDPERLGCIGVSFGGTMTMCVSALDERIKAAVICCYIGTLRDMISRSSFCGAQILAGLARYGDISDIASLIAPRPLLVKIAKQDPYFPYEGAISAYQEIERNYSSIGHSDKIAKDVFEGGHEFDETGVWEWFKCWL